MCPGYPRFSGRSADNLEDDADTFGESEAADRDPAGSGPPVAEEDRRK